MEIKTLNVFIQERSGDYNLEREYVTFSYLSEVVESIQRQGGYYTEGEQEGKKAFIPWHRIDRIEEL